MASLIDNTVRYPVLTWHISVKVKFLGCKIEEQTSPVIQLYSLIARENTEAIKE
jgi:hypothetical protein